MSSSNIICSLIGFKKNPLVVYTENPNMKTRCIKHLGYIKLNTSGSFELDGYKIYYINKNYISYLIMTNSGFPKTTVKTCLENIINEFEETFPDNDFNNISEYGLEKKFKEKLRLKSEYYNKNKEVNDSSDDSDLEEMFKVNDDLLSSSTVLTVSDIIEKELKLLQEDQSKEEYSNHKASNKICTKRIIIIIIIAVLILLGIIYLIIGLYCDSWAFQCS